MTLQMLIEHYLKHRHEEIPEDKKVRKHDKKTKEDAIEMYKDGIKAREISESLFVKHRTVLSWIREYQLKEKGK